MVLTSTQVQHIIGTMVTCISYRQTLANAVPMLRSYLHPVDQSLSQWKTLIANLKAKLYIDIFKMVTLYLWIGRYNYILAILYSSLISETKKKNLPPVSLRHHFSKVVLVCDYLPFHGTQASKYPYYLAVLWEWIVRQNLLKSAA